MLCGGLKHSSHDNCPSPQAIQVSNSHKHKSTSNGVVIPPPTTHQLCYLAETLRASSKKERKTLQAQASRAGAVPPSMSRDVCVPNKALDIIARHHFYVLCPVLYVNPPTILLGHCSTDRRGSDWPMDRRWVRHEQAQFS